MKRGGSMRGFAAAMKGCCSNDGMECRNGQVGCQVTGSDGGKAAAIAIQVVACPWHFSAVMPTIQRTDERGAVFAADWDCVPCDFACDFATVQQDGRADGGWSSCSQQLGAGCCSEACATRHPQPLARHASSDPQWQTR